VAKQRVIRASEIGAYVYCHRAWWLRTVGGIEPADRARFDHGIEAHHRHGSRVRLARVLVVVGLALVVVALLMLVIG
jgi:CRISPR/Cas system-associated exonuclease Cas4 (RecB family)